MVQLLLSNRSLIEETIQRIKDHEPPEGYYLAFSGGKDSICIYHLAKMAGVKFRAVYRFTTIDPKGVPEFVRKYYPDVEFDYPTDKNGKRINFYSLVAKYGLPWRLQRWCCHYLKETGGGKGSTVMVGVRREESSARSKREMYYEFKNKFMFLPIYDWTSVDVWEFIHENNFPYPDLYDNGHKRLGCVLCPLACRKARIRDYEEYPERVKVLEKQMAMYIKRKGDTFHSEWGDNPHDIVKYWVYQSPVESAKGVCMQQQLGEDKDEL